jgi:DNA-binding NarL/FixJ family response regulator
LTGGPSSPKLVLPVTTPTPPIQALLLDEGDAASLDALATAVAIFGGGRFDLVYADDRDSLRYMADQLAAAGSSAVIVVDVDGHPQPKDLLAEVAEAGFPVAVVTDGRRDAIADHALSVGAAAYLPTSLPAQELVSLLGALPRPPEHDTRLAG